MKKLLVLIAIILVASFNTIMAQPPGGGQRQTPEERKAMLIERLKPLNLTAVQQDSAVVILSERPAMGNFQDMTPEQRQDAMKTFTEARNKRLEKALGADLAKKVIETIPARGGGRQGGGGNN
jgi:hypothetical protein